MINTLYVIFLISIGWLCLGFIVVFNQKVRNDWIKPLYLQEWLVFCCLWPLVLFNVDYGNKRD